MVHRLVLNTLLPQRGVFWCLELLICLRSQKLGHCSSNVGVTLEHHLLFQGQVTSLCCSLTCRWSTPDLYGEKGQPTQQAAVLTHLHHTTGKRRVQPPAPPKYRPSPLPTKKKINHLAEFSRDFKMTTNVLLFCWRDIWNTNTPTSSNTRPHFMLPKPLIMCCGSRMPSTWRNIIINFVTLQYEQRFSETCSNCAVVCRT